MSERNPYRPPASNLSVEPRQADANVWIPVVVGAAIGEGLGYVAQSLSGIVFLWVLVGEGVPVQELYARAYAATGYVLFAHAIGFCCMAAGGYWTMRLSGGQKLVSAAFAGAMIALFAVLQNLYPFDLPIPVWSRLLSIVLPVPSFLLGAWVHNKMPTVGIKWRM